MGPFRNEESRMGSTAGRNTIQQMSQMEIGPVWVLQMHQYPQPLVS